jgi:uncharacterized protein (DUF488 family)
MEEKREIFTVGHSNHTIDYFYELLESQQINCLVDVRSMPASKYSPQFNQEPLKNFLKSKGVVYMHFKDEFGARHEEEEVLDENGQVDFELFRKTFNFQQGVERVDIGASKGYRIALMCSEGDPLECHRFSMIAFYLDEIGFDVKHIMKDKQLKTHKQLEDLLLKKYSKKLPEPSLFEPNITDESKLKEAYRLHNKEIGWVVKQNKQNKINYYD